MKYYEYIKSLIRKKGYRVEFVADKIGITKQSLSYKLNGKTDFKWLEIIKIIDFLDCSESEKLLLFGKIVS